jgi:hypothetical protein
VFARPVPGCDTDCRDQRFRVVLRHIAADPQLQTFFGQYESDNAAADTGSGGLAKLVGIMNRSLSQMGPGEDAFSSVQVLLEQLRTFVSNRPEFAGLSTSLDELEPILQELFSQPSAGEPFQDRLKRLSRCLVRVDPESLVTGELVGLLGRPGGSGEGGLDLIEVVDLLDRLAEADPQGRMASMTHAVLASTCAGEASVEGVRLFMRDFLGAANGRAALPSLQRMLEAGVLDELLTMLDHLVNGCAATGTGFSP